MLRAKTWCVIGDVLNTSKAASRVVTVAPAVAITTLAGYAASVLVTGAAGALRVGEPIAGESFATVLVVSLNSCSRITRPSVALQSTQLNSTQLSVAMDPRISASSRADPA